MRITILMIAAIAVALGTPVALGAVMEALAPETAETVRWKFTAGQGQPLSLTRSAEKLESATCRFVRTKDGYYGRIEQVTEKSAWIPVPEPSRAYYFGDDPNLRRWMKHCGAIASGLPEALPEVVR